MNNRSINFYIIAVLILLACAIPTIAKTFIDVHPLRYLFVVIFVIGIIVGYLRYLMKLKKESMQNKSKWLRYGFVLLFVLAYMAIRYGVRTVVSYEVSGDDYGIVMAFFILGLFISYYGLNLVQLWKAKKQ
ncbi:MULTISPECIES: hypothetical protein [Brevibacillus]|uniref:hypothetical protein n=1 Tax=Brevibacillus TaxID=55080 RepID=UPI0004F3B378|nr:hypothetical protein [Brevibacillus borstelensis]KKX52622.1 hypothetical protein X546_24255 [Brevibacillus borstelensis cifa_chp40]MBE5395670.1 hypothetical protein [Brevibacillus borstelensis]MCM3623511.1 hypothetical protein [Brevibacillus borstelensis]MED1744376.1 hypothetical protein [Brevibacillus borstelensis]MED2008801.1 hypothetical protein [Brevibacillus borstelensis]